MTHSSYEASLSKAKEKIKLRSFSEAEQELFSAIQMNPQGYEAFFLLGGLYHDQGKFDRAVAAYKKALLLKPNYTEASLSLSILFNDLGHYEEGRLIFNRSRKQVEAEEYDPSLNEKLSQKHVELGELYETYNRFIEADHEYQKAFDLMPNNPHIILKRAKLYEKEGKGSQAVKLLQDLLNKDAKFTPARIRLGLAYYTQGRIIEAIGEWEKALDIEPNHAEALMYMEMAQKASTTKV